MSMVSLARALLLKGHSTDEVAAFVTEFSPSDNISKPKSTKNVRAGLTYTEERVYDSLLDLGGKGRLGSIHANCDSPGQKDATGWRPAYSTVSYTLNNLLRKEVVGWKDGFYAIL